MNGDTRIFPDCCFTLSELPDAEADLNRRLEQRSPFSMVRLGDGEGAVLSRPRQEDKELWSWAQRLFGAQITPADLCELADQLQEAIDSADMIGIRSDIVNVDFPEINFDLPKDQFLQRFVSAFHLRSAEKGIALPGALRIAHTHRFLGQYGFSKATIFSSAWIHFHLSASGALVQYLSGQERPALVSGQMRLANELQRSLGKKIDFYSLPSNYPSNGNRSNLDAYLEAYRRTCDLIDVKYPGQVFFVGGGIWSKVICSRVKKLGGIALDIGAVCDAWIGIPSRFLVFKSMFNSQGNTVPECLLLSAQMNNRASSQ